MTQWRVCVYPTHESILVIDEIYGTQKEAKDRFNSINDAKDIIPTAHRGIRDDRP